MAVLVPCSSCRRHLRRHEPQCPFCGAQQPPRPASRRQLAIPRDASRATLFALGLTLAGQACGGRTDDDPVQKGNGASTGTGSGGSQGTAGSASGGAGGSAGRMQETCADNPLLAGCGPGGTQERCANDPLLPECGPTTPPYGGIPLHPPGNAGAAGSGGTSDAGSPDADAKDAGGGDATPDQDAGD
jgi:hypothetical protein